MSDSTKPAASPEFEMAEQLRVHALEAELRIILTACGFDLDEVIVTDESLVGDFVPSIPTGARTTRFFGGRMHHINVTRPDVERIRAIGDKLGIVLSENEYLVDVALRLRALGRT